MKRVVAALLLVALLLCGCAPSSRPAPDGQPPMAAIRSAVLAHGSRMPDGSCRIQRQKGTLLFAVTAPPDRGAFFSLEMRAAGLRHTFAIVPDVSRGVCACTYAVTGGDKPLRINGSIDARAYPKDGSITADESPDYPAARARELFEQYTPLLLDAVQEMLEGCGAAGAVRDLFPGFIRKNAIRI